jgi:Fe-Mn family superoxide dismutase
VSHHDNNYAGAVKNLQQGQEELSQITADTPGFVVGGLKERELAFTNSAILHELYFGNLGGDGRAAGSIQKELSDACGSFARWEEIFRATGMSLAGGSGWTVLDFNFHTGDLRTYWSGNHTQSLAAGYPLLVMDNEHSSPGSTWAAARLGATLDAFFQNLNWDAGREPAARARAQGRRHAQF